MKNILAVETGTDACSVALSCGEAVKQLHEVTPRQHSQRLLAMLEELVPGGALVEQGIEAIAYGCGPGSFTGLRIAASAVQGMAYASGLPVLPVSTLATQASTAARLGHVVEGGWIFSALDARINEVYYAWYRFEAGRIESVTDAVACSPADVAAPAQCNMAVGIGSGCLFLDEIPALRDLLTATHAELLPQARDMIPLAREALQCGQAQTANQVQPVYVRDEINWKKIPQQGKRT